MVKITRSVFGIAVFHYDIVGYVVYASRGIPAQSAQDGPVCTGLDGNGAS